MNTKPRDLASAEQLEAIGALGARRGLVGVDLDYASEFVHGLRLRDLSASEADTVLHQIEGGPQGCATA